MVEVRTLEVDGSRDPPLLNEAVLEATLALDDAEGSTMTLDEDEDGSPMTLEEDEDGPTTPLETPDVDTVAVKIGALEVVALTDAAELVDDGGSIITLLETPGLEDEGPAALLDTPELEDDGSTMLLEMTELEDDGSTTLELDRVAEVTVLKVLETLETSDVAEETVEDVAEERMDELEDEAGHETIALGGFTNVGISFGNTFVQSVRP